MSLRELPPARGMAQRAADKRGYTTPLGPLPSVTTILSATSPNKERLQKWLERPDSAAISEAARNRGTWLHSQVEAWIAAHAKGEPFKPPPHFAFGGYWRNIHPWLEAHWHQLVAQEQAVYHALRYSGTFDALGYVAYGAQPEALTLLDWKTSQRKRDEALVADYKLQLGAYANAIHYCYGIRPERALLVIARPKGDCPDIWELSDKELFTAGKGFNQRLSEFFAMPTEEAA